MGQFHVTAEYQPDDHLQPSNQNQDIHNENELSEGQFLLIHQLADVEFDLVIDLQRSPAIKTVLPPLGYFAITNNVEQLDQVLESLPDWIGVFDKPKYYDYLADRCALIAQIVLSVVLSVLIVARLKQFNPAVVKLKWIHTCVRAVVIV